MVWTSDDSKKALLATAVPGGAAMTAFLAFVNDRDVVDWWTLNVHPTNAISRKLVLNKFGVANEAFIESFECSNDFKKTKKPNWAPKDVRLYSALDLLTMSPLGYASYLVYKTGGGFDYADTKVALGIYGMNIAFALATIPLLKKKNLRCLFYNTALLNATAVAASYTFYKIDRTAGLLLIPYALWTGFYAFLTYAIAKDNQPQEPDENIVKVKTTSM
ncbi:unnamed protein product [Toxocara canis]|uniref:TspO/MBR family protein n=1 Tax=Toxocara canis TaxID=6265 RepID=A0A183URM5_TOXCA|nr:unnamed protein product [Toxocara canis]